MVLINLDSDISDNQLIGTIPESLGKLVKLIELYVINWISRLALSLTFPPSNSILKQLFEQQSLDGDDPC